MKSNGISDSKPTPNYLQTYQRALFCHGQNEPILSTLWHTYYLMLCKYVFCFIMSTQSGPQKDKHFCVIKWSMKKCLFDLIQYLFQT